MSPVTPITAKDLIHFLLFPPLREQRVDEDLRSSALEEGIEWDLRESYIWPEG